MGEQCRPIAVAVFSVFLALSFSTSALAAPASNEARTARFFEQIKAQPVPLAIFLRRMPKGGDLHNHLSGAIYAESKIAWAAADGRCVTLATMVVSGAPCAPGAVPVASAIKGRTAYHDMVDAFSMRDFVAHWARAATTTSSPPSTSSARPMRAATRKASPRRPTAPRRITCPIWS